MKIKAFMKATGMMVAGVMARVLFCCTHYVVLRFVARFFLCLYYITTKPICLICIKDSEA